MGQANERKAEKGAGSAEQGVPDLRRESTGLLTFVQCQLTSSSVFQKLGGNCPSIWVPGLEIVYKILHFCVSFYRGLQICKSVTPRKVENHSKSHLQNDFLPKLKLLNCISVYLRFSLFLKLQILASFYIWSIRLGSSYISDVS